MKLVLLVVLVVAFVLIGCSETRMVETSRVVTVSVPDALLTCPDAPALPDGDYSQRDIALLVIALHERGEACAAALAAIRDYLTAAASPQ